MIKEGRGCTPVCAARLACMPFASKLAFKVAQLPPHVSPQHFRAVMLPFLPFRISAPHPQFPSVSPPQEHTPRKQLLLGDGREVAAHGLDVNSMLFTAPAQINGIQHGNIGTEALEGAFQDDMISNTLVRGGGQLSLCVCLSLRMQGAAAPASMCVCACLQFECCTTQL